MATLIFGSNSAMERREFWTLISSTAGLVAGSPWCMLGDFNTVHKPSKRQDGSLAWLFVDEELDNCISLAD